MDNRGERKTSGESSASDSSETASCRPYYLPETPAGFWYAPCRASTARVSDYSQSPSDLIDFRTSNQPCSSYYPSLRLPLSVTFPTQSNSVSNSTPLNKSGEEKRRLSTSWSTPDPKQAKLTRVDKTVAFKESTPSDLELNDLAVKIGSKWQKLGLGLGISQKVLDEIKTNGEDRPYEMLLRWRDTTASTTFYRDLYYALCHQRVGLDNVAKEFCVTDSEASTEDIFDVKFCFPAELSSVQLQWQFHKMIAPKTENVH